MGSTIAFISGFALVGSGITLTLAAPRPSATPSTQSATVTISPHVGWAGAGFSLRGSF
jgi:hypothetical protein